MKPKRSFKTLLRRYWLIILIPLVVFGAPSIYLLGLDFAWPCPNKSPEKLVQSLIKKADKNRRRTDRINSSPIVDYLSWTYDIRDHLVFRSCGYKGTLNSQYFELQDCHSLYHDAKSMKIVDPKVDHDHAEIEVRNKKGSFFYRLNKTGKKWKLSSVIFVDEPNTPIIPSKNYEHWLSEIQPASEFSYDPKVAVNSPSPFTSVPSSSIQIEEFGEILLPSGIIGIHTIDASGKQALAPLDYKVQPGTYLIKKHLLNSRYPTATEIVFNPTEPTTKFIPAKTVTKPITTKPLTRYLTCIFDCQSMNTLSSREYQYWRKYQLFSFYKYPLTSLTEKKINSDRNSSLPGYMHIYQQFTTSPPLYYWGVSIDEQITSLLVVDPIY